MPEGHVLHRLASMVTDTFGGRPARVSSPQGRFAEAVDLDGAVVEGAEAAGKHLFIEFAGDRIVHIHLGLIGALDFTAPPLAGPVGQVRLRMVSPDGWAADLRGATRCDLIGPARKQAVLAGLGPDPIVVGADPDPAWQRIRASHRMIGDLLMDQAVIAGVGNVYRAEVLFRQRMDPRRPGRTLRRSQFDAIWDDLVDLMADGVRVGSIDTVRPEHTPAAMGRAPREDDHGGEVYVYRRQGQACHVCGATVRTEVLGGRNLFWCPRCQPRFRSRARR